MQSQSNLKYPFSVAPKAEKCLKKIADTSVTGKAVAIALGTYPVQSWAYKARKNIFGENPDRIFSALARLDHKEIYSKKIEKTFYRHNLESTEKILKAVEEGIDEVSLLPGKGNIYGDTLKHFHIEDTLASGDYYFHRYYYEAVLRFISVKGKEIEELLNSVMDTDNNTFFVDYDSELKKLYHNTGTLLAMYCDKTNYGVLCNEGFFLSEQAMCTILRKSIDEIGKLPDIGELYKAILLAYVSFEVCDEYGISETTYFRLKKKARQLLSYLLWGFSTRDIMAYFV